MDHFRSSMRHREAGIMAGVAALGFLLCISSVARAGKLTVEVGGDGQEIAFVGAVQRWDQDGNHRRLPDPKAKIDVPAVDATAARSEGCQWVFKDLPKGTYDLVILGKNRLRVEGFTFAPVKEFDPFISADAKVDEEARGLILDDIKQSQHYENIVTPLYLAGDAKAVRVLMMLIRDKPTSYESESAGAATMRHEVWQFSWHYGGWQKERRTKVLDRVLLDRNELRKWTWLWDPKLGGIEIGQQPVAIKYKLPSPGGEKTLKGLYPY
jgi:hypothetical protein